MTPPCRWIGVKGAASQDPKGWRMSKLTSFLKDESASTAAEYALIIAFVGLGIAGQAFALGEAISDGLGATATTISNP